jgi:hypothetical protein
MQGLESPPLHDKSESSEDDLKEEQSKIQSLLEVGWLHWQDLLNQTDLD